MSDIKRKVKILAFTDVHGSMRCLRKIKEKSKRAGILVFAGDLTLFGSGLSKVTGFLSKIKKDIVLINGNHEEESELRRAASRHPNLHFISGRHAVVGGILFIGYSKGYFSSRSSSFPDFLARMKRIIKRNSEKQLVFVTHAPPYKTNTDLIDGEHFGNRDVRDFITAVKPSVVITGHLHEAFHKRDTLKKTLIINPGPDGRIVYLRL